VAEIRPFGFNFAPKGWAQCNGQILPISQNTALFALLGTIYGGDGKSTFGLPGLQNAVPRAPGASGATHNVGLGETAGQATVTLLQSEMPAHTHMVQASTEPGTVSQPAGQMFARASGTSLYNDTTQPTALLNPSAVTPAGGSLPHNNVQPSLVLSLCIALQGVFPPRG
jgi:microcystin-dependent protein